MGADPVIRQDIPPPPPGFTIVSGGGASVPPPPAPPTGPVRPEATRARAQPRAMPRIQFTDDVDALTRTVIGEAGNQGPVGMRSVAAVALNRARNRNMAPRDVVLAPNQFEPWGTADSAARLMAIPASDPRYQAARREVEAAMAGDDPTGGATHFYAPKAQAALGRQRPAWDNGTGRAIGDHLFFNLPDGPYGGEAPSDDVQFTAGSAIPPPPPGFSVLDDLNIHQTANVDMNAAAALNAGERVGTQSNPYVIPDGLGANDPEVRNALNMLTKGDYFVYRDPEDGKQYVERLTADPYVDEGRTNDTEIAGGNARLAPRDISDNLRAVVMGAAEQIPGLDEGAVALAGALNGRGYSETRDSYQAAQAIDNQAAGGARDIGGILGFAGTTLAPMGGVSRFIQGAQGAGRAAQIARAGAVGLGSGAVYGGASAEGSLADRAPSAALGALIGAGTAGTVQGAAPLAREVGRRVGSGIEEAAATVGRGFGRRVDNVEITPEATQGASQYVQRLIESSGADLPSAIARAGGKPITAAEAIGPRGVATAAALGRREGRTSLMASTQLSSRAFERQQRIVQDMADITGLDPAGAADLVENVVTTGRTAARPLYEAAYATPVQPTNAINRILARPHSKAALRRAYSLMRNEDQNPEALGLFVMESRGGLPTGRGRSIIPERDADLISDLDALRNGTRTVGSGRGDSLLEFISKNGGVRDDGGDLASIGADRWQRDGAWRSRVVRDDGLSMEDMAQRARDAGYFDDVADAAADSTDNYQRLSSRDLTAAIDDELRGNARFARERGDTERGVRADLRKERRDALEERLNREGVDISRVSNEEAVRILREAEDMDARNMAFLEGDGPDAPRVELVEGEIPSMQTLDYVKRGLDQLLAGYRDKVTGRLVLDDAGRAIQNSARELRDELTNLNPSYREALATSGDYLSAQAAFDRAEQLFRTGTSARTFRQAIERMGDGERRALTAGIVDKIYRDAERNAVRMQDLVAPVTQQKLSMLLGVPAADDLTRRIGVEIEMAAGGARMAPGTNSITSDVLIANAELDSANPIIEGLIRGSETGVTGIVAQAGRALLAPAAGFIRGAATPAPRAMRDEIGRLLMLSPDDLLAEMRTVTPDATRQDAGALARLLRQEAGSVSGRSTASANSQSGAQNSRQEPRRAQR